jgi:hypothetical protein
MGTNVSLSGSDLDRYAKGLEYAYIGIFFLKVGYTRCDVAWFVELTEFNQRIIHRFGTLSPVTVCVDLKK